MLEQRVAHLERDMGEVKASLGRIEAALAKFDGRFEKADERLRKLELDVAGMKERLALMPTTWTALTLIVAMTGLVLAVLRFAPRL
jgi:septal ring factor EnvC (AmiA/AmiB activator)